MPFLAGVFLSKSLECLIPSPIKIFPNCSLNFFFNTNPFPWGFCYCSILQLIFIQKLEIKVSKKKLPMVNNKNSLLTQKLTPILTSLVLLSKPN